MQPFIPAFHHLLWIVLDIGSRMKRAVYLWLLIWWWCVVLASKIAHGFVVVVESSVRVATAASSGVVGQSKDSYSQTPKSKRLQFQKCIERNKQIMSYGEQSNWKALLKLFEEQGCDFNAVNFSTAISKLVNMRALPRDDPVFQAFLIALATSSAAPEPATSPRAFAMTVHCLAKLDVCNNQVVAQVFNKLSNPTAASQFVANSIANQIATTAAAYAKQGHSSPELFAALESRPEWLVAQATTPEIAMLARACAKLGHSSPKLFAAIHGQPERIMASSNPRDIADVVEASKILGHSLGPELVSNENTTAVLPRREYIIRNEKIMAYGNQKDWSAILTLFQEQGSEFTTINFSTAISQLVKIPALKEDDPAFQEFLTALAGRALEPDTDPRSFANVVHALAKLNTPNNESVDQVFQKLSDPTAASKFIDNATTQSIAMTARACAELDYSCPALFAALEGQWDRFMADAKPQAIANTAWACAILDQSCPILFAGLESQCGRLVAQATAQEIVMIARACAKLGHSSPKLFGAISGQMERIMASSNPRDIAAVVGASKILGHSLGPELESNESTTAELPRRVNIMRNEKIMAYGNLKDWRAILTLFQEQGSEFSTINFSTAIAQLVKIPALMKDDPAFQAFLTALAGSTLEPDTDPRSFANVVHALAKLNTRNNESVVRVFQKLSDPTAVSQFVKKANTQQIANTAWACATLDYSCPTLFAALESQWEQFVVDAKPQYITNTAWACAKLDHSCPTLFAALEGQWERFVAHAEPQHIANTALACAKLCHPSPTLFSSLESQWERFVAQATAQEIAMVARACVKLDHSSPKLFGAINGQPERILASSNPRDVADVVWASKILGHALGPELESNERTTVVLDEIACIERNKKIMACGNQRDWRAILTLFQEQGSKFSTINFSTAISQLVNIPSLKKDDPSFQALLSALAGLAALEPASDPRSFANVVHALAKLNTRNNESVNRVFLKLFDPTAASQFVDKANMQDISNTAWACAELGHSCPKFFAALESHAKEFVAKGDPQNIANTALACAKLGHSSPALFAAIESKSILFVEQANPQHIANTATACAVLGHLCPDLFAAIKSESKRFLADAKSYEIAELARACDKLGHELSAELSSAIQSRS
jgi:hypothetical protein